MSFFLDLESKEEFKNKQLASNFEETNKYSPKKLSIYHLKIVESRLIFLLLLF